LRLVLDACTLASGIAGLRHRGPSPLFVTALAAGRFDAIISPRLLDELGRSLRKPYFQERITEEPITGALEALATLTGLVDDPAEPARVLRDPTDDYLVALARESGAEAIVTGDKDLLDQPGPRAVGDHGPRGLLAAEADRRLTRPAESSPGRGNPRSARSAGWLPSPALGTD